MKRREAASKPKTRKVAQIAHYSPGPAAALVLAGLMLRSRTGAQEGEG